MDYFTIAKIATKCSSTLHLFGGVWSSDNFPKFKIDCVEKQKTSNPNKKKTEPSLKISQLRKIQIINSSLSNKSGEHWILLCAIDTGDHVGIFVWDCLSRPLCYYDQFYSRLCLWKLHGKCGGFQAIKLPLQKLHSNLSGLYCLYLVHYLVRKPLNIYKLQKNPTLMQTTEIEILCFLTNMLNIVNLNVKPGNIVNL